MSLRHEPATTAAEPRYDSDMLRKVTALADRLQSQHHEKMTAREIEAIGAELGLDPAFIQQALSELEVQNRASPAPQPPPPPPTAGTAAVAPPAPYLPAQTAAPAQRHAGASHHPVGEVLNSVAGLFKGVSPQAAASAWWAGGWTLPFASLAFMPGGHGETFLIGIGVYIGVGKLLSASANDAKAKAARQPPSPMMAPTVAPLPPGDVSRATMLNHLFTLQRQLEAQKQHCAFLSVDVVASTEMKRNSPELAVEYSFGQFTQWVDETVRGCGGTVQSAAGDGMMCVFSDDAAALYAAQRLQIGMAQFNAERNHLALPFRIRCGVSAGDVALTHGMSVGHLQSAVVDRAALFQKTAEPGDIVVGGELAGTALTVLGYLAPLPTPVHHETAFSWYAGQRNHR
jgi:class 3 adenylate cyclase